MTYEEYKAQAQKEFDELPIFWAFGREQFKKAMEERGLTENDTDKIYSLGAGGYYLKADAKIIKDFFDKPHKLEDLMKDYEFAKSAIYYEMCNHEYGINWQGNWDVCNCFSKNELPYYGDDLYGMDEVNKYADIMGWTEDTRRAWRDALAQYNKDAMEKEWF